MLAVICPSPQASPWTDTVAAQGVFDESFPNRVVTMDSSEREATGVMVHRVPDEGVDVGPVLATEDVRILPDDTLETLESRIHSVEHRLLVETIRTLCEQRKEITA